MAAYAALVSVMQTIHQIEHHPSPPISMDKKQVESLTEIVLFLQEFLEGYKSPFADGDEVDPLEMRIADAVYAAEDVIESHIVHQIRPDVLVWYEALRNVIEGTDFTFELKSWLRRQVPADSSAYAYFYLTLRWREHEVIKGMDWITAVKGRLLQRRVSSSADFLYKSQMKVIEHMDLIRKQVLQIFALRDELIKRPFSESVGSSTFEDFCTSVEKVIEDMDLIEKEVMEIVALKDERWVSASSDFHESLRKVIEDMDLIKKEVVALKDQQVSSSSAGSLTSSKDSSLSRLNNTTMMGFEDVMLRLMEKLVYGELGRQVIPIVGMGGIGKTTLAEHVYAHPSISQHFDMCAWVTISQQYNTKELLYEILSQANTQRLSEMGEDEIGLSLHRCLSHRRYLIVLDDMWSIESWEKLQRYLPNNSNGSRIMVTTRLSNLGSQLDNNYSLQMEFMNEESSWNMFNKIVFGGKSCPLELEKIGKKIVESCRGLPLSIVVMGGLLEKMERTTECWESIRESINSLVNLENDKYCLKILKLSYNHLPINLKLCFMYLGMFEEDSEIQVSTLIKLWVSEGFLKPINGKSLETVAKEYLDELVDRNIVLAHKFGKTGSLKYLKMHDLLRDLSLREAEKEKFYHVVGQHSPQDTCSQRRVVISRNTSDKKFLDAMRSTHGTQVDSLSKLRLLMTLKTYKYGRIKGCNLFELVNLRLLIFHSGWSSFNIPASINLLWSLQTLIVYSKRKVDAPVEIWNMPQLRHVHFYGFGVSKNITMALCLPDPPCDKIVIMENLQTLKGVRNFTCDEMMVRRIPNIQKLELIYDCLHDGYCLHNIERLQKLESFHCIGGVRDDDSLRNLTFPQTLKSVALYISNGGMEVIMEKVSTLPLLQKLKLKGGYFRTGKWETVEDQFISLKYLSLVSCISLKWWMMESSHFPCLEHLYLYTPSLKEIPAELGEIPTLKSVTIVNCWKESAVKSAKRMVEEQEELQGEDQLSFKVIVRLGHAYYGEDHDELLSLASPNFQISL